VKEPIMTRAFLASTIVAFCLVACAAEDSAQLAGEPGANDPNAPAPDTQDPNNPAPNTPPGTTTPTPPVPGACEAQAHVGFGKQDFVADRKPGEIGSNRRRVKPYSVLGTEFKRALGVTPAGLATNVAAFGDVPARWFAEPQEGAVSLYTTYMLAFTTCYDTMTSANFTAAPTATTAPAECATMQRKFWQRTPAPDEIQACADFTLGLTTEANPRRRWAHACASILTAAGFTTY
jgi:hypothetical protein